MLISQTLKPFLSWKYLLYPPSIYPHYMYLPPPPPKKKKKKEEEENFAVEKKKQDSGKQLYIKKFKLCAMLPFSSYYMFGWKKK